MPAKNNTQKVMSSVKNHPMYLSCLRILMLIEVHTMYYELQLGKKYYESYLKETQQSMLKYLGVNHLTESLHATAVISQVNMFEKK